MESVNYAKLGLSGSLPIDSAKLYNQGYRSGLGNVNVNLKPLNGTLRKIGARQGELTKVRAKRLANAVKVGLIQVLEVGGKPVYLERRERVGKYFSANGGHIEPSKVSVIARMRAGTAQVKERKFVRVVDPKPKEEDVTKVNAVTYTLEGYGKIVYDSKERIKALPAKKSAFEKMRELLAT
jgi:hypothetical protein